MISLDLFSGIAVTFCPSLSVSIAVFVCAAFALVLALYKAHDMEKLLITHTPAVGS